jgi:hypothetical protein
MLAKAQKKKISKRFRLTATWHRSAHHISTQNITKQIATNPKELVSGSKKAGSKPTPNLEFDHRCFWGQILCP